MVKILCLPGFATNKEIMSFQLRHLKKTFSNFEFITIDPFYELEKERIFSNNPELLSLIGKEAKIFSWLSYGEPVFTDIPIACQKLANIINEKGPFDGLLGFSMGGRVIHSLIKFLEDGSIKLKVALPKFYIFICGFMSFEINEINQQLSSSNAKTIHLLCLKDDLFLPSYYMTLKYKSPLIMMFNQGHKIPIIDNESNQKIKKFIENLEKKKNKPKRRIFGGL